MAALAGQADDTQILPAVIRPHDWHRTSVTERWALMHVRSSRGGCSEHHSGPHCLPLGPSGSTGRLLLLSSTAAALLAVAGCGGGGGTAAGAASTSTPEAATTGATGKATTLRIQADPSGALRFDKQTLSARPGKVAIVMTNPSPLRHDIAIEGNGMDVTEAVVSKGGTSTVSADLKPGTYTFLCTVDGHADAGMKGTLTIS
jgi:plastocyanin